MNDIDRGYGVEHRPVSWQRLLQAKRLMKSTPGFGRGLDLYEAAHMVKVRPRDLDLALWNNLGGEEW